MVLFIGNVGWCSSPCGRRTRVVFALQREGTEYMCSWSTVRFSSRQSLDEKRKPCPWCIKENHSWQTIPEQHSLLSQLQVNDIYILFFNFGVWYGGRNNMWVFFVNIITCIKSNFQKHSWARELSQPSSYVLVETICIQPTCI